MKTCMKSGCDEEALRGLMYCSSHRPNLGTRAKKVASARKTAARKPAGRKAAKKV